MIRCRLPANGRNREHDIDINFDKDKRWKLQHKSFAVLSRWEWSTMKQITTSLMLALLCVMLSSCGDFSKEGALTAQWKQENERLALGLGERVFKKDYDLVFSAIMIACLKANLAVQKAERTSGFVFAEGRSPLSDDAAMPLNRRRLDDIGRCWGYSQQKNPQLATDANLYRLTTAIARLGKSETKVKLHLTSTSHKGIGGQACQEEGYPPIMEAIYMQLWQQIDRQVFVQEHLIHRHLSPAPLW
jgi:hypothetical protein